MTKIKVQLFGGRGVGSGGSMRNYYLNQMSNPKARNIVDQLYRPGAKHGDGGTADALKEEAKSNKPIEGKRHYQKAKERLRNIENVLKKENLLEREIKALKEIYEKLKEAIKAWEQRN